MSASGLPGASPGFEEAILGAGLTPRSRRWTTPPAAPTGRRGALALLQARPGARASRTADRPLPFPLLRHRLADASAGGPGGHRAPGRRAPRPAGGLASGGSGDELGPGADRRIARPTRWRPASTRFCPEGLCSPACASARREEGRAVLELLAALDPADRPRPPGPGGGAGPGGRDVGLRRRARGAFHDDGCRPARRGLSPPNSGRWTGRPRLVCCEGCREPGPSDSGRCQPGHACVFDCYAKRIDRFFRWEPGAGQ